MSFLSNNKEIKRDVLALLYLAGLTALMIAFSASPYLYAAFFICAAIFILPSNDYLGLVLLVALDMYFERFFALQGLQIDRDVYKFYLLDIVFALTALAAGLRIWKQKDLLPKRRWLDGLLLAFLCIVVASFARSYFDINADMSLSFSSLKNYLIYPLLYFLVPIIIDSAESFKKFVHLILIAACGLILYIAYGFISGVGLWTEYTPLSTAGTRYLAGTFAYFMMISLLLCGSLLAAKRWRQPWFVLIIMFLWSVGIAVSLMRHLWLAAAVGIITVAILSGRASWQYLKIWLVKIGLIVATVAAIIILVGTIFFSTNSSAATSTAASLISRIESAGNLSDDTSVTWRQDFWREAKNAWKQQPLAGIGFGHTLLVDEAGTMSFEEIKNIHNSPLAITVQMGLIGIGIFLIFIFSVVYQSLKRLNRSADLRPYIVGLIAALVATLIASLFQPYLETNITGIWFWLLLGLLAASLNIIDKSPDENPTN